MSSQKLGQLCMYGISKIKDSLAEVLYDEGVEPEKRARVKEEMQRRLEDLAQDLIVEALSRGMLNRVRLEETLRSKKKRSIIMEKEES